MKFKEKYKAKENDYLNNEKYCAIEIAYYIGERRILEKEFRELIDNTDNIIDGYILFGLFIEFITDKFLNEDGADIYKYIFYEQERLFKEFKEEFFED